jgi:hypothetical protein
MKNLIYVFLGAALAVSCQKEEPVVNATTPADVVTRAEFDSIAVAVEPFGFWREDVLAKVISVDNNICTLTVEERYDYLMSYVPADRSGTDIETIVTRTTGSPNVNGGRAFWDCNPSVLASTIASLGTTCPVNAPNNYANTGTSATVINLSDVLRAANGLANTSFDDVLNIEDIVFVFAVSGDGNWLVDVTLTYQGQPYIFSDALAASGETIPGVIIGNSLIYDPIDGGIGGIAIVGPMPGGITQVLATGDWPTPPSID